MNITYATYITLLRILLAPAVCYAVADHAWLLALVLFTAALLTDFFDGYVARRFHQESMLGALLDPIADKTLILTSFVAILKTTVISPICSAAIFLLLTKEVLILVAAAWLYTAKTIFIKPTFLSRLASVLEMIFIMLLMVSQLYMLDAGFIDRFSLFVAFVSVILLLRYANYMVYLVRNGTV